jgi:hypothetical protein
MTTLGDQGSHESGDKESGRWDVIVCGDGLFALWVSCLLTKAGVRLLRIHSSPSGLSPLVPGLGVVWPSMPDPPTRLAVAHGLGAARELEAFVHGASVASAAALAGVARPLTGTCLRLGLQQHEATELAAAARQFPRLKPVGRLREVRGEAASVAALDEDDVAILGDVESGMAEKLLRGEDPQTRLCATVVGIAEEAHGVRVQCADGRAFECDVLVLGLGANLGKVWPQYKDICVPASDALGWLKVHRGVRLSAKTAAHTHGHDHGHQTGAYAHAVAFRASSGHVAGVLLWDAKAERVELRMTGPRYALRHAGMGWFPQDGELHPGALFEQAWSGQAQLIMAALAELHPQCAAAAQALSEVLAEGAGASAAPQFRLTTECWPCDELPMLGELGFRGRVLGSAGWLGCGHSVALWCAQAVRDLVVRGRVESVPDLPFLSPKRFWTR